MAFATVGLLEGCLKGPKPLRKGHPAPAKLLQLLNNICQSTGGVVDEEGSDKWLLQQAAAASLAHIHMVSATSH